MITTRKLAEAVLEKLHGGQHKYSPRELKNMTQFLEDNQQTLKKHLDENANSARNAETLVEKLAFPEELMPHKVRQSEPSIVLQTPQSTQIPQSKQTPQHNETRHQKEATAQRQQQPVAKPKTHPQPEKQTDQNPTLSGADPNLAGSTNSQAQQFKETQAGMKLHRDYGGTEKYDERYNAMGQNKRDENQDGMGQQGEDELQQRNEMGEESRDITQHPQAAPSTTHKKEEEEGEQCQWTPPKPTPYS